VIRWINESEGRKRTLDKDRHHLRWLDKHLYGIPLPEIDRDRVDRITRWHDLRHTWASWHVQNGTPLHVLQELGDWSDIKMVLRYAHLGGQHLQEYAGNVGRWHKSGTTFKDVAKNG
jgi:integrase